MVFNRKFFHLAFIMYTFLFYSMFMLGAYKNYALENGFTNDWLLALIGSMAYAVNAASRIVWGYSLDRFSYKKVMALLMLI